MRFLENEKGEFTVEATIVFTISFMTIILMLYIGVVMYQHVHLQSATDRIASRGAMMYATRTTDMETAKKSEDDFLNCDPYRYFFPDRVYKESAKEAISGALKSALGSGNIISSTDADTPSVQIDLGLFTKKVVVNAERQFNVPFVGVFDIDNSMFNLNLTSTAYILDMPENIRNIDYACDLLNRLEFVGKAKTVLSNASEKIKEFNAKLNIK